MHFARIARSTGMGSASVASSSPRSASVMASQPGMIGLPMSYISWSDLGEAGHDFP
jgi:hypothetical protein